jgi:FkbM family methyltransferase
MNISGISDKSLAGKALRFPLRLIPPDMVLPILQGKLRGFKWMVGSSNHGCWLGSYEHHKRREFERMVAKGSVVFDVGANAGFYTLLASVLVGPLGKVFAFEPLPQNLVYLKEHLRINGIKNVSVIDAAVADCAGVAHFDEGPTLAMGHLAADGSFTVNTVSLDQMFRTGKLPPPDCIKIDVEGAEADVLLGAKSLLTALHPTIFLATHSKELHSTCYELLRSLGYTVEYLDRADEVLAYAKHRTSEELDAC